MDEFAPKLPVDRWAEDFVTFLDDHRGGVFDLISAGIAGTVDLFHLILTGMPPWLCALLFVLLAWRFCSKATVIFTAVGLLLIQNLGYWENTMETLALVLASTLLCVVLGVPLGIYCARHDVFRNTVTPMLDFMQTMPAFVYLIPAIFFFGLGEVPGVIASVIFAMPPIVRMTNHGIRQVPAELVEAADAFGSTPAQKLIKVQLPQAKSTILAGMNQCIMLALSMVVISAMIGADGLGSDVYRAVSQVNIGKGFEAGLTIVIMAIMLDRLTQQFGKRERRE